MSMAGRSFRNFFDEDLVDQMIVSLIPVVLGSGIPLFSHVGHERWCRLVATIAYSNGLLQLHYEVTPVAGVMQ